MKLDEQLLQAWVGMTYLFKNNRLTKGLTYNEATILMYLYHEKDRGNVEVPLKTLLAKTKMTKSLMNRTVDALVEKGMIEKVKGREDARTAYIHLLSHSDETFQSIHNNSLKMIQEVIDVIGEEDAKAFVRIYEKLEKVEIGD